MLVPLSTRQNMKLIFPALLFSSVALLSACAPMGERGNPPRGNDVEMGRDSGGSIVSDLQNRLQQTAEALNLTPTQAVLWDAYQEKVGALMADQLKIQPYRSKQTAMQQIAQKVDTVRLRLTAMEDIQESAGKLYAALDAKQKLTADQMLPATVPALYSGIGSSGGSSEGRGNNRQEGPSGRGGPGGGMGGGPGGGMGGGFGRM